MARGAVVGGVERINALSDGVFAIALTLLALPLATADIDEDRVSQDLLGLAPQFVESTRQPRSCSTRRRSSWRG